ncbi:MAG TPA: excinuclease ABC subunit UvrA [Candidatus Thermoplasmatota archaeon]|nr:excinuclease ABC subunit UvrA [Candidatus Thermoplasmatota archaeon]
MSGSIIVRGAREHNLKGIDVEIPRGKLVVVTGLSGSGKSSLAFDTIYAEGQRRYVESLSAYARQFLGQMKKPEVDHIEGLSPAISIDQKTTSRNPRSTVGTTTEVYDYLRLLWAHVGIPHCPKCERPIGKMSVDQIVAETNRLPVGTRIQVLAPIVRSRKGEFAKTWKDLQAQGFVRVRVDGQFGEVTDAWKLEKNLKHSIDVVVDRLTVNPGPEGDERLGDAIETALRTAEGLVTIWSERPGPDGKPVPHEELYSEAFGCPDHGAVLPELTPRMFSFNAPHGACPGCSGLGYSLQPDEEKVIRDKTRSIRQGCFHPDVFLYKSWMGRWLEHVCQSLGVPTHRPWQELTEAQKEVVLYGSPEGIATRWGSEANWEGIAVRMQRLLKESESEKAKERLQEFMAERPCGACKGKRLKPEVLAVTIHGSSIIDSTRLSVTDALRWFRELPERLSERENKVAKEILKEITERLRFLDDVGLGYLSLDRSSGTLSGGESQRIRLASQIGSGLQGVLYVLDEPSIGLHQRDNHRLLATLKRLRDLENTVLVVEHDEDTMREADYLVDLGPGAGEHGGRLVAAGTPAEVAADPASLTGQYLSGKVGIPVPASRRPVDPRRQLRIVGASENNLKNVSVDIPLGVFVAVTGVSGSGKSTLINETLYKGALRHLGLQTEKPAAHKAILNLQEIDKVIDIDQSPIGRTPRSNPATYTGVWTPIRDLFAMTQDAKQRGYTTGRFSFNVKGGRCEACEGDGVVKIEMHFLPDVYVPCEVCKGARYNRETLQVKFKGKNIREVLDMSVEEGIQFFDNVPGIRHKLQTIADVGLGYIRLGQPATQLSGGEAQRVKLATELSKRGTGRTLYILDEPTTGLHIHDVRHLLGVLQRLVDAGNSVVVIEHNLDVVKCADWVIDLGPEGGDAGGMVVAEGTPEEVAEVEASHTGRFLKPLLQPAAGKLGELAPAPKAKRMPRTKRA